MRLEHHLVGGYVHYISPHIIIIIIKKIQLPLCCLQELAQKFCTDHVSIDGGLTFTYSN